MQKFRKRPVEIEAIQWIGELGHRPDAEVVQWLGNNCGPIRLTGNSPRLVINTLEGPLEASPGDWIIKGVKGEFYPCKPDIFAATYYPVICPDCNGAGKLYVNNAPCTSCNSTGLKQSRGQSPSGKDSE